MQKERLYIYDTTLRDGQQTMGVQFSCADKIAITAALDALGGDYIEGGWPGATPVDTEFCQDPDYRATGRDRRNRIRFWIEDIFGFEISKKHYQPLD